jgi:polyhydroxyalkanoate synthesis regulator protein
MQAFLPSFLELSLDSFIRQQEQVKAQWAKVTPGGAAFDEQIRQNMALFDRAMKMFSPFAYRADEVQPAATKPGPEPDTLAELKAQMAAMQAKLEALAKGK